jgi:hypothetical protein
MNITAAQARQAAGFASLAWNPAVKDWRSHINLVHPHKAVLTLLCLAFAAGQCAFRHVEDFCSDLSAATTKKLGLTRDVSDSTAYRMVKHQKPDGLRESVKAQVLQMAKDKVIKRDRLDDGVASFDGKEFFNSTTHGVDGAKVSVNEKAGVITSSLMAVRAVLSSSLVTPFLDMEIIGEKAGEAPAFRTLFPRVLEAFGHLFEIVTGDSGIGCRENAELVSDAKKDYVFSLKGIQKSVEQAAIDLFAADSSTPFKDAGEVRDGGTLTREITAVAVDMHSATEFVGSKQFWRVVQRLVVGGKLMKEEIRLFVVSLDIGVIGPEKALALVRIHWAIENNHNWTMDMKLMEDDVQPCQHTKESLTVVCWLRMMGYNMVSAFRARAPKKDRKPQPWKRTMDKLRDALCVDVKEDAAPIV